MRDRGQWGLGWIPVTEAIGHTHDHRGVQPQSDFVVILLCAFETGSLCSTGCPRALYVAQAGPDPRDSPASAF